MVFPDKFEIFSDGVRFVSEAQIAWWSKSFEPVRMMPKNICDRLTEGLPGERERHVARLDPNGERTDVIILGTDAAGKVFETGRSFHFNERFINLDLADVREDFQKKGYGRSLTRNSYRLAAALGFNCISLTAMHVGSYSWARLGFMPTISSWNGANCIGKIRVRLLALRQYLSRDLYLEVLDYVTSSEPEVIWLIADKEEMIPSQSGHLIPLGVALLYESGASWYGTIELKSCVTRSKQIGRVRDYLGLSANE